MPVPDDHEVDQLLHRLFGGTNEINRPQPPAALSGLTPAQIKILRSLFTISLLLMISVLFVTQAPGIVTNFFHAFPAAFPTPAP
jgi:hypothetical protein